MDNVKVERHNFGRRGRGSSSCDGGIRNGGRESIGRLQLLPLVLLTPGLVVAAGGHGRAYGVEDKLPMLRGYDGGALRELLVIVERERNW